MAELEKVVSVVLRGQDELTGALKSATKSLDRFSGSITGATQPLADMAADVLKVEAALAALAIGGLALAYNESMKFESAVTELQKVIGDEVHLLDDAGDAALELSDKYGVSASSVLLSTAEFKQAGFDIEGAMKLTAASLDLVIAGDLEAAEASEILVAALKGFKAPAEDAARLVDILNEVSNNYATDVEQLGIGMAALSPIASQMGFSFEETAGILTPVIEVFRSGDEAAVALKTGLLKLVDDSKPVQEALESIGVSQRDANGELRSGKDILNDVSTAFVDLEDNQKLYITQQLVGINQAGRMVEVFDQLNKTQEVTATALDSSGSAALEVAARLETAEVAVDRFKVGLENLGIIIGDQFLVAATEAVDGATKIEQAIAGAVDAGTFDPIFDVINQFSSDMGQMLSAIAAELPQAFEELDWSKLLDSIANLKGEVGDLFEAFFGDIDLTTAEGLEEALQKIVDAIAAVTNVAAGIIDAWEPFVEMISEMIDKFSDADAETQELVGEFLGFAQAINTVFENIGSLTGALEAMVNLISIKMVASLLSGVGGLDGLTAALGKAGPAVGTLAGAAGALVAGWEIGKLLAEEFPIINEWADQIILAGDSIFGFLSKVEDTSKFMSQEDLLSTEELVKKVQALDDAIEDVPAEKDVSVIIDEAEMEKTISAIKKQAEEIGKIPDEVETKVSADVDDQTFKTVEGLIIEYIPETGTYEITAEADAKQLQDTKEKIDKELPSEKMMEIKLQGDIDTEIERIKAQADTIQTAMEWEAKIDIAAIEADAEKAKAAFESVGQSIESSGDVLVAMFDKFGDLTALQQLTLEDYIDRELAIQQQLVDAQTALIESQIAINEEQLESIKRGESLITIDGTGLEPELEAFMIKILENIQIQAQVEGQDFLVGIPVS